MKLLHRAASIAGWIFRRNRAESRLDDELQALVEIAAAEKMRDGMGANEARRQARMELGGVEQLKEEVRTGRHGYLLDEVGRDVKYAARMLVRSPGFSAVVIILLALGIGANTAIFNLIDALMLRSLPVRNANELVLLNLRARASEPAAGEESFSYPILRALDDQRDVFAGVAGFTSMGFDVAAAGTVTRIPGALVTGSFYETLGLAPAAGRLLSKTDDEAGAPLVAVISDAFWERQFARSPAAVGQMIQANAVSIAIVGVTPRGFSGASAGSAPDITMAVSALPRLRPSMAALVGPGNFWLRALARPRPGPSPDQAAARLNAVWPALADSVIAPHWPAARRTAIAESVFVLEPGATGWSYLRERYQRPLYVLMAAVGLVLLIACANIASLWLARASARQREIAVRLAIGASRSRIVRQLLIESTMLSTAGAVVGVGLAWLLSRFLVELIADRAGDLVFDLAPSWRVLGFATVAAIVTGLAFGLAPIRRTSVDALVALRDDQRTATRRSRLQPALVTAQVALSLVLIAGAGLFVRTLTNLRGLDPGFLSDSAFVVRLARDTSPSAQELAETVRQVPGVMDATLTTHTPLDGSSWSEAVVPAGRPLPETDNARVVAVDARFFETMQIPIASGRGFTEADSRGGAPVVVINERYAAREFPGENPVGRRLTTTLMGQAVDLEIIGVARNSIFAGLRGGATAVIYVPFGKFGGPHEPTLVFRTAGHAGAVTRAVRSALQLRLPTSFIEVRALDAQVAESIARERLMATLAGAFGVLALGLASIGLYGLLANHVAQRSREIGIRVALGSRASQVVGLVLAKSARLVLAGLLIGLPTALAASRWVESMLFGVTPGDPVIVGSATGVLVLSAFLASYLPARRAARVKPLVALRNE